MPQKFDMPSLRRRCKKLMRKKHKKTIKLNEVDKIWKNYVEYGIVRPLLKYGKVEIDKFTSVEIVGERAKSKHQSLYIEKIVTHKAHREGLLYSVIMNDKNYKGKLIFHAYSKIKKRVHEELKNTNTYYRVCQ